MGIVFAFSAGACATTLLMMVDTVKRTPSPFRQKVAFPLSAFCASDPIIKYSYDNLIAVGQVVFCRQEYFVPGKNVLFRARTFCSKCTLLTKIQP
jgi:hypothetical protein